MIRRIPYLVRRLVIPLAVVAYLVWRLPSPW